MRLCAWQRAVAGARRLPIALLATLLLTGALAISYTVQVVAVSEQESALSVQRTLLNDSFPAYVVRASTIQGDIYRVRVGAFGNRDAALRFARTMPVVAGSPPLPALAEGIPAGVMPFEPRILAELSVRRLGVLPWGESIALRTQENAAEEATYLVVAGERPWSFQAWRAAPVEGGVLRLRNLPLWPATWEDDVPEAREAYRSALLESLATRFDTSVGELEELQSRPVYGPPFLVILELVQARGGVDATALGVARPAGSAFGPSELVIGSGPLPEVPEPIYQATGDSPPAGEEFIGEGWRVAPSDEFFLLSTDYSDRAWRAGVGVPLWSDGRYLLTRAENVLLLYDFVGN